MPITKSAKKALRQSVRRRERNLKASRALKNQLKQTKKLIEGKQGGEAKSLLPRVYKSLDKAVRRGLLKKNTASRTKSRLTRAVSKSEK